MAIKILKKIIPVILLKMEYYFLRSFVEIISIEVIVNIVSFPSISSVNVSLTSFPMID